MTNSYGDEILAPACSKQTVVHMGPSLQGVGGIETVVRTYVFNEWSSLECEALATWNKTTPDRQHRFLALKAAIRLIQKSTSSDELPIVHVHLSHRGSFIREGALLVLARRLGFCVVATIHGSAFVSSGQAKHWRSLYRWVLSKAHAVCVLNELALATVNKMRLLPPALLVRNPGPLGATKHISRTPGSCDPLVVFAGTVGPRKGVDTLIASWPLVLSEVPDAKLEVWGPVEDVMRDSIGASHFKGATTAIEVSKRLLECRVAVLPSTAEAMPMFVLEAMGAGRPSVVTDVGAMPNQIGAGGIVVPVGDSDRLAQALVCYLLDPSLADKDGHVARELYEKSFNVDETEKGLRQIYQIALNSKKVLGA